VAACIRNEATAATPHHPVMPQSLRDLCVPVCFLLLAACGGGAAPLYNNATFGSAMGDQNLPDASPQFTQFLQGRGNGNTGGNTSFPQPGNTAADTIPGTSDPSSRLVATVIVALGTLDEIAGTGTVLGKTGQDLFTAGIRSTSSPVEQTALLTRLMQDLDSPSGSDVNHPSRILGAGHEEAMQAAFLTLPCDGDASGGTNPFGGSYQIQSFRAATDKGFFLSGNVMTVNFYDCILGERVYRGGLNIADFRHQAVADEGSYDQIMSGEISFNGLSLERREKGESGGRRIGLATNTGAPIGFTIRLRQGEAVSTTLASGTLTLSRNDVQDAQDDRLLDLAITIQYDSVSTRYTLNASGTLLSDLADGIITVATPTPLSWQRGASHPGEGTLRIDTSKGRITAMALGGSLVRITTDTDGDGLAEAENTFAWNNLNL